MGKRGAVQRGDIKSVCPESGHCWMTLNIPDRGGIASSGLVTDCRQLRLCHATLDLAEGVEEHVVVGDRLLDELKEKEHF